MSVDPQAPANQPDTPNPAETQAEIDWQKRYQDLHPEFTRKSQAAAEYERLLNGEDPEAFQRLLDRMGYELDAGDGDEEDYVDDSEQYVDDQQGEMYGEDDPRWQQVEQYIASQEEEKHNQLRAQDWAGWDNYVRDQAKAQGVELTDREMKAMVADCIGEDGFPVPQANADAVLKQHLEWRTEFAQQLQPPKRPRAPHVPGGGSPADGDPGVDLTTREGRNAYMNARLQAES